MQDAGRLESEKKLVTEAELRGERVRGFICYTADFEDGRKDQEQRNARLVNAGKGKKMISSQILQKKYSDADTLFQEYGRPFGTYDQ